MLRRCLIGGLLAAAIAVAYLGIFGFPKTESLTAADTKQETILKKEVAALQAQLNQSQQQLQAAQQQNGQLNNTINQLKNQKNTGGGSADLQKQINNLKTQVAPLQAMKNAPYVHSVVLSLKKDSPTAEVQSLLTDLPSLGTISTVRGIWFGTPAALGIPDTAANNYTVGVTLLFDDFNGLKKYYTDPIHQKYVDKHLQYWEVPVIYNYTTTTTAP